MPKAKLIILDDIDDEKEEAKDNVRKWFYSDLIASKEFINYRIGHVNTKLTKSICDIMKGVVKHD